MKEMNGAELADTTRCAIFAGEIVDDKVTTFLTVDGGPNATISRVVLDVE
ncbi:hypothetical protein TRICHSKD4_1097 [Roseibium sp. TrichSKD4]|nr:hypothetical protein TRICHSKD4_1097 [Roseibium sp. TrichSKD4]